MIQAARQPKFRPYPKWWEMPQDVMRQLVTDLSQSEKNVIMRLLDLCSPTGGRMAVTSLRYLAGDIGLKSGQHVARMIRSINAKADAGKCDWKIYRELRPGRVTFYRIHYEHRVRGPRLAAPTLTGPVPRTPRERQLELFKDLPPSPPAKRPKRSPPSTTTEAPVAAAVHPTPRAATVAFTGSEHAMRITPSEPSDHLPAMRVCLQPSQYANWPTAGTGNDVSLPFVRDDRPARPAAAAPAVDRRGTQSLAIACRFAVVAALAGRARPYCQPPVGLIDTPRPRPLPPDPAAGTLFAKRERFNLFAAAGPPDLAHRLAQAFDDRRCRRVRIRANDKRLRWLLNCQPMDGHRVMLWLETDDPTQPERVIVAVTELGSLEFYT